jgi:hypothetical protein
MKIILLALLSVLSCALSAQILKWPSIVEGRVLNKETKEPIAYANIYNKTFQVGTISNTDGYFRISVNGPSDLIFISIIGFKKQVLLQENKIMFYTIYLEESVQLLNEVRIVAPDDSYLFKLLDECKNTASKTNKAAKAYYELKSFVNDKQIELVEGFYNADVQGCDLTALNMKVGRFALKKYGNRLFTSQESSKAVTMIKMFRQNSYFPQNPLDLSRYKIKKYFYLELNKKYRNDDLDSIYVIGFRPKDSSGAFFNGQIWINPLKKHIIKITLNCSNCRIHPFLPLFSTDSLTNVDIRITKTFKEFNEEIFFNHIDFNYHIDYISRRKENNYSYAISTKAILYAYDYDNIFTIPKFEFADENMRDYNKINAMPYNNFFWKKNDEFRLNDDKNQNQQFFNENEANSNRTLFAGNTSTKVSIFESPFIPWSENRILLREIVPDSLKNLGQSNLKSDQYNLSVKIFMDINSYADSTNILTATIFDPWDSYYHLSMDNSTICFINIYFDLYEIERRKFVKDLEISDKSNDVVQKLYRDLLLRLEKQKKQYLKEVERGTKQEEMVKWNKYIAKNLNVDNLKLFDPYKDIK